MTQVNVRVAPDFTHRGQMIIFRESQDRRTVLGQVVASAAGEPINMREVHARERRPPARRVADDANKLGEAEEWWPVTASVHDVDWEIEEDQSRQPYSRITRD